MPMLFKIAFRNTLRNKRRTVITLSAIIFGCVALIINGGLIFYIFDQLKDAAIYGRYGHVQIYKRGYVENHMANPMKYVIDSQDYERLRKLIKRHVPQVRDITARLEFFALANNGDKTVSFIGLGVEPEKDGRLSRRSQSDDGDVDLTQLTILDGEGLSQEHPFEVLVGQGLSRRVGAKVGDYLTLLTNTREGAINAVEVRVRGIFASGWKELDDWIMRVHLDCARELTRVDAVDSVIVVLKNTDDTDVARDVIKSLVGRNGLDIELRVWSELAVFHNQVVAMFGKELTIIKFIVAAIVVLSIINTMTMSVLERTPEIGAMMAMGTKRRDVLNVFMVEALVLGVAGGTLGIAVGILLARLISYVGIEMPPPPTATHGFVARVEIVPSVLLYSFAIAIISTLIAALYPAFKASRLRVIEALRHA